VHPAPNPDPVFETKHYSDGSSATGVAPLPNQSGVDGSSAALRTGPASPADIDAEAKARIGAKQVSVPPPQVVADNAAFEAAVTQRVAEVEAEDAQKERTRVAL